MIHNRRAKLARIHMAKKELGLDDTSYRALLSGAAGIESAAAISTEDQYRNIIAALAKAGWRGLYPRPDRYQDGAWSPKVTARQRRKIQVLWSTKARNPTYHALKSFIWRTCGVKSVYMLDRNMASTLITALEKL